MRSAVNMIEIVSYGLIILIGVRLLWVKGLAFFREAASSKSTGRRRYRRGALAHHAHGH